MACGTPVIAYRCGSVPEVVEDGITGYIVDGIEAAVAAVDRLEALDRGLIRQHFEDRFSAERMAREYLAVYNGAQDMIELPMQPPISTTAPTAVAIPRSIPPDLIPS
jgi:glycosyltransferase involved in cell wall biosynthesis